MGPQTNIIYLWRHQDTQHNSRKTNILFWKTYGSRKSSISEIDFFEFFQKIWAPTNHDQGRKPKVMPLPGCLWPDDSCMMPPLALFMICLDVISIKQPFGVFKTGSIGPEIRFFCCVSWFLNVIIGVLGDFNYFKMAN